MIEAVIAMSVRYRWAVIVTSVAMAAIGIYAAYETPIDAIPDLSENQVIVFAEWLGHTPREIEEQVTHPVALAMKGMEDVRVIRTSSDVNYAMIHVVFTDAVDVVTARQRVDEHLRRAASSLPAGVVPKLAPEAPATGQILWYTLEGTEHDLGELRALQDWYVGPQLGAVDGVAEVAGVGGYVIEYQIEVDPEKLAALGGTLQQVSQAIERSGLVAGGHVIERAGQEFVVQVDARIGMDDLGEFQTERACHDLEQLLVPISSGRVITLADIAQVSTGPGPRRGIFEKDGNEVVGGVVMMRYGQNPVRVIERVRAKMESLQAGLPPSVRIVVGYDRTPLIRAAISTVSNALLEAMITAAVCVLIVMRHVRSSLIIAVTLPLATLGSFVAMWILRVTGMANLETNIMSLAGLTISIGVLVDSSIVMTESVVHRLYQRFGSSPVRGDVRNEVVSACKMVGRPIFFSVLIMLLSFLPVFGLMGLEGKLFRPLAFAKTFAMMAVAILSITLVPALCSLLIRGRLRSENDNWLVRSLMDVYRPVLEYFLDRPAALLWILGCTFLCGIAPLGQPFWFLTVLGLSFLACGWTARSAKGSALSILGLAIVALFAQRMTTLNSEFVTPLDEGVVMDMPITIPRIALSQAGDDLKARDMMLCRFPEVDMVMGKVGRAETPTDPAPIDMIETMVMLRPREFWPRRKMTYEDAERFAAQVHDGLTDLDVADLFNSPEDRDRAIEKTARDQLPRFDALMREYAYHRHREFARMLYDQSDVSPVNPYERYAKEWRRHVRKLDTELIERGAATWVRLCLEDALLTRPTKAHEVADAVDKLRSYRLTGPANIAPTATDHHVKIIAPDLDPMPDVDQLQVKLAEAVSRKCVLWRAEREDLGGFGGEMDRSVQMPGWTNVWTRPIQNRVDMLNTGIDSLIGVRVLGPSQSSVVSVSEQIASLLQEIPGATGVIADPVRGKSYLNIRLDRQRAAELGVDVAEAQQIVEIATGGSLSGTVVAGRQRHPLRLRLTRKWRDGEENLKRLPVPVNTFQNVPQPAFNDQLVLANGGLSDLSALGLPSSLPGAPVSLSTIPLEQVAEVRTQQGPATIKGENGLLRNYVRLDVRGRDALDFLEEAKQKVAEQIALPPGVYVEWTGRFERWERFRRTLYWLVPLVLVLIVGLLLATYRDVIDAILMLLAVPGAIAGGLLMQWLLGFKFSVTVIIGYIACFGMATATGVIMLVYLRQAIAQASAQHGGLGGLTLAQLRQAVVDGAALRLRPKLLTEATTIIGLAPMLWATGAGAEIIRPMAAPVLGGILIADEVIDLLLPVLFFWVRRWRWQRLQSSTNQGIANDN